MTITEFLEARIAEDEERNNPGPDPSGDCGYLHGVHYESARVLAECAAKRALCNLHSPGEYRGQRVCNDCGDWWDGSPIEYPCDTVKIVAAVYADHPGYDESWRL